MLVIRVRNVHDALPEAMWQMRAHGVAHDSRNGLVAVHPEPVTTVYERPQERVLFHPERDANPFFHFYEGLWMLGGRNDVASLTGFVQRMSEYSDDGVTFHGAYGHRWRHHFSVDQLEVVGRCLRANKDDRRQVVQMYDAAVDCAVDNQNAKDIPCNLSIHFQVRNSALDMTVFNRSNDIIWGTYGANAVHFSMLQEFMAAHVGVPIGRYWQVSDNWHAYMAPYKKIVGLADKAFQPYRIVQWTSPYEHIENGVTPYRMINGPVDTWLAELNMFLEEGNEALGYTDPFFRRVALPMLRAHTIYKGGTNLDKPQRFSTARVAAQDIAATDWRRAALEWIERRQKSWEKKQDGSNKSGA